MVAGCKLLCLVTYDGFVSITLLSLYLSPFGCCFIIGAIVLVSIIVKITELFFGIFKKIGFHCFSFCPIYSHQFSFSFTILLKDTIQYL